MALSYKAAYEAGFEAGKAGKTAEDCPYGLNSRMANRRSQWLVGLSDGLKQRSKTSHPTVGGSQ